MTTLVYIGGYGRSGSTLLEYLLAASPDVLACGEVVGCVRTRMSPKCTCGERPQDCPVWKPFYESGVISHDWSHNSLTLALVNHASGRYGIVVDSSKTAWGSTSAPFEFRRKLGKAFRLVHLVRDPRGVCWSNVRGIRQRNGRRLPEIQGSPARVLRHLRTLLGWWAANLSCELFGWIYKDQYAAVTYEDLAVSTDDALDKLFVTLALGQSPKLSEINKNNNRHQLFGNRVRYQALSPSQLRWDDRWKTEMPPFQRWIVSVLSCPLRFRYGY